MHVILYTLLTRNVSFGVRRSDEPHLLKNVPFAYDLGSSEVGATLLSNGIKWRTEVYDHMFLCGVLLEALWEWEGFVGSQVHM